VSKAQKPAPVRRAIPPVKKVEDKDFAQTLVAVRKDLKGMTIHVLSMPWEAKSIATTMGAKWHPELRCHLYEGLTLPPQLAPYASEDFSLERWIEDELNGFMKPITPSPGRMTPRPHQKPAIKKIIACGKAGWRGFILADNVGLGKSLEAIIGAYGIAQYKGFSPAKKATLLIISPKSVIPHWRNTIKASGVDNMRIVVINYDQAKKLLDVPAKAAAAAKTKTKNKLSALYGKPTIRWDLIIADESHKLKNVSQRQNAFNKIARYSEAATTAPFVIWASATVGQNPLEIGYMAPLISQINGGGPIPVKEWGKWLMANNFLVKESVAGNYSWIAPKKEHSPSQRAEIQKLQAKDVTRLADMLFGAKSPSIRRNPEEISGWPTQSHYPTPLDLDGNETALYLQVWNEFRSFMNMHPRGKNPSGGLAATMRFQQKASLITAPHTASFANDLLDNGLQVALSVKFIETLDTIKEALEKKGWVVAEFSGRNTSEREEERLKFQRGDAQVILFTVEEGISLHAGEQLSTGEIASSNQRVLLIHDVRYSSIAMSQILGRATRDGQLAAAYYMYAENTIEPQILNVMLQKMKNLRTLSGDDDSTIDVIHDILDGINHVVRDVTKTL
jgi:superfamily II DNA or RNA helicase